MGGSVAWAARWAAHSVGDWMLTRSQRPCSRPACRSSSNEPACGSSGASVPAEGSRGRGRQGGKDQGGAAEHQDQQRGGGQGQGPGWGGGAASPLKQISAGRR